MSQAAGKSRLETWKEIAAYLGKDERTVRRWEAERGLPVRRLPGQSRSRIYAETEALDRWMAGAQTHDEPTAPANEPIHAAEPAPAGEDQRPAPRRPGRRVYIAGAVLAAACAASASG
jgi:excisionase family DNA binding protein